MTTVCDHGYWLHDCALCEKRPGECDFGSCTEQAVTRLETTNARGVVVERRAMCARHAPRVVCSCVAAANPELTEPDPACAFHAASAPDG
jgi:hypothetical protein